jgi:ABC-type glycerol-3-phosphate transport system substrate-binding protein
VDQYRARGGQDPATQAIADVLAGRISRRAFIRRAVLLGLSGGTIAAVIAACGPGTPSSAPASAASSAPSGPPSVAPSAAAFDPMKFAGEKVRIAIVDGERDEAGLKDKIPEIKERMGIDVELTTMALGALLESNNQNLRAPESAFDVLHVLGFSVAGTVGADLFHELTPWVDDPTRTPADYDLADFPKGALDYCGYFDIATGAFGGDKLYLIPGIHSGSCILFYRKDLLDAAGLAVPTDWDAYLAAAEKLHTGDVAGNSMIGANDVSLFLVDWYTRFITMGGNLTTGSKKDKTLQTNFTSPEAVRALQHMIDCAKFAPAAVASYGFTEGLDAFSTGKVAMMLFWSTIGGSIYNPETSTVAETTETAVMPADAGQTPRAVRGGWGLGIPKNLPDKNKDVAWHFLTYLTSAEFEKYQVKTYQTDPNRASTFIDPDLTATLPHLPIAGEAAESAQILEVADIPETFAIVGEAAREFNLALTGAQDAATACQKAQDACLAILRTGGHLA